MTRIPRQTRIERNPVCHTPSIGHVHAVIAAPSARLVFLNWAGVIDSLSGEQGCCESDGADGGIDGDALALMQAEHVNVLDFDRRTFLERPGVAAVPLLRVGIPVLGI